MTALSMTDSLLHTKKRVTIIEMNIHEVEADGKQQY
jgi:hypothetical protein